MARPAIRTSLLLLALAWLPCCGGSGGGGGGGPGIHGVSPGTFYSEIAAPLTVNGAGFGAPAAATVRLTAASGTPFVGGTAAFVDVAATVASDSTITLTSPLATLCPSAPVPVAVRVTLADATVYDSAGPVATLAGPTLGGFSPSPVPATVPTAFSIGWTGIGPALGTASLQFTASAGTPFLGGTSATATVVGAIASPGRITGTTPVAAPGADFSCTVTATFSNGSCVASAAGFAPFEANAAPVLATSAPGDLQLALGDRVSFTVSATDAEGDLVTLRLLNPPAGATFAPIVGAPSPATGTVRWVVGPLDEPGPQALFFRANDDVNPSKTRTLAVWIHLTPTAVRTVRLGDVTGDGIPDVVALARNADVNGVADAGEIYVWAGGAAPSGTPLAWLRVNNAASGDRLGSGGVRLADVSGDGVLDVIASSDEADDGLVADAGAIYVWRGGPGLTGTRTADAVLTAGPIGASTGLAGDPLLWQVGDVTGDGIADVVAAAPKADNGATDTGGVYVWRGGAGLSGPRTWDIELVESPIVAGDQAGAGGILLADLSGDGVLDVLSSAPYADASPSVLDSGALLYWIPSLVPPGPPAIRTPQATLQATGAVSGERLGAAAAVACRVEDVSGDGIPDVIAPSPLATGGAVGSGAIYVWRGGAGLVGAKAQDATLEAAAPSAGDALGGGAGGRVLVGDVTGDGLADVLGVATAAAQGIVAGAGAAYVWLGGATLTGTKTPHATLAVPIPSPGDSLGSGGTRLADVTNDGVLDIVVAAPLADRGGIFNSGAVYVWRGGGALSGPTAPEASLGVAGAPEDRLAFEPKQITFASRFADVTGDGALDLVVPAYQADRGGAIDVGAVYVWAGGPALTAAPPPDATLVVPGAASGEQVGRSSGPCVALADVSGDGIFDVVAAAPSADVLGLPNSGAIYAWRGGDLGITATMSPTATLRAASPGYGDQIAGAVADGVTWDLGDANGDGVRDVVAVACRADVAGRVDAGTGYLWAGGPGLAAQRVPTATFGPQGAGSGDLFGCSGGSVDLLFLADLTGDGILDLLIGASAYTGGSIPERGGLFLWKGAAALSGNPSPSASLLVPSPAALDRLGN